MPTPTLKNVGWTPSVFNVNATTPIRRPVPNLNRRTPTNPRTKTKTKTIDPLPVPKKRAVPITTVTVHPPFIPPVNRTTVSLGLIPVRLSDFDVKKRKRKLKKKEERCGRKKNIVCFWPGTKHIQEIGPI